MAYTTINDPEAYFQVKLTTGTGSVQAVTFDGDTDMQPDLIWGKRRDSTGHHSIFDNVRGITKGIEANNTGAEWTSTDYYTAFGSDGFTIAAGSSGAGNGSSQTAVQWCWKESAAAGFDIVTYTGTGSARTVSHSLSAVPHFLMVKKLNATGGWSTGHHSLGWTNEVQLQSADAAGASTPAFNDTDPTSSVFTLGSGANGNSDTDAFVGYVFTGKQGYSKFGSYTGNANTNGPFIYTGFRPAYILIKQTTNGSQKWEVFDNKRDGYNDGNRRLYPDDNAAEPGATDRVRFCSNGFKLVTSGGTHVNGDGTTHIYAAFAEAPLVNSAGIPCNAR